MDSQSLIVRDRAICAGQPTIWGTRVLIRTILASLADRDSHEEILRDFPALTVDHLRLVVRYAAASAQKDLPTPGVPSWR